MKLTILTDNCAGGKFLAEHGLSYLLESNGAKVLLDTGHSDVFIKNAQLLGIDIIKDINTVVLSHGHWDHGNGLQFLKNKKLITHPLSFIERFRKTDHSSIGLAMTQEEVSKRFELTLSEKPFNITDNIVFLGEIPRITDFESQTTTFIDNDDKPDFVPDDSALVVIENEQLNIISGCSHSGICNIIQYAIDVTGIESVNAVIGGFHLKHNNKQTKDTIKFLKQHSITKVYPSHCTELEALMAFKADFNISQVKTGTTITL